MNIADKIKKIRVAKGLAQKEVALTIGIDRAQYSRIESGKVEPTISSLLKIAKALGVRIEDFFTEGNSFDVSSYDKSLVDRLRLIEQLDEEQKRSIFTIIDIALANKKLRDTLSTALQEAV